MQAFATDEGYGFCNGAVQKELAFQRSRSFREEPVPADRFQYTFKSMDITSVHRAVYNAEDMFIYVQVKKHICHYTCMHNTCSDYYYTIHIRVSSTASTSMASLSKSSRKMLRSGIT